MIPAPRAAMDSWFDFSSPYSGAPFFMVDGEPFWGNDCKAQRLASGPF